MTIIRIYRVSMWDKKISPEDRFCYPTWME